MQRAELAGKLGNADGAGRAGGHGEWESSASALELGRCWDATRHLEPAGLPSPVDHAPQGILQVGTGSDRPAHRGCMNQKSSGPSTALEA